MRHYIIRRILQIIPVMIAVSILVFVMAHSAPGSPTSKMMNPNMTAQEKARIETKMGLDKSFTQQYITWASKIVKGDFGQSTRFSMPVKEVIEKHMWNTFYLSVFSLIIALLIGIPAGIISATKQYSKLDYFFTIIALFGISIPAFFFGLLMIKIFSVDLGIFPISGMISPGMKGAPFSKLLPDIFMHSVLPAIVLGLLGTATFMRYTRSAMLEVIKQDYIRTARAKGLTEKIVIYKHAFRNALIPIITLLGFWLPFLFSGAVMTETVFGWPGMGKMGYDAIFDRDYQLLMGVTLFLSMLTLVGNLLADIFYAVADPRIKYD